MRYVPTIVFGLLTLPALAYADQNVAGFWQADLGDNVVIEMNVTADGQWNSQTIQADEPIAEMAGVYRQYPKSASTGNLVFIPHQSHVTSGHGAPRVEHDRYELSGDGETLSLTSNDDQMDFHKLTP